MGAAAGEEEVAVENAGERIEAGQAVLALVLRLEALGLAVALLRFPQPAPGEEGGAVFGALIHLLKEIGRLDLAGVADGLTPGADRAVEIRSSKSEIRRFSFRGFVRIRILDFGFRVFQLSQGEEQFAEGSRT